MFVCGWFLFLCDESVFLRLSRATAKNGRVLTTIGVGKGYNLFTLCEFVAFVSYAESARGGNNYDSLVIQKSNIVVDGVGKALQINLKKRKSRRREKRAKRIFMHWCETL